VTPGRQMCQGRPRESTGNVNLAINRATSRSHIPAKFNDANDWATRTVVKALPKLEFP
jgi:hypothetical protein